MSYSFCASFSAAFLVSTFLLGGLTHAKSGGMDSGGGDYHDAHYGSAWFLGEAPIPTCFEVSNDFGVDRLLVRKQLEAALQKWRAFVKPAGMFSNSIYLNTELSEGITTECDLKFYFGGQNEEVMTARSHHERPIGLAERQKYDAQKGRSQGLIWIAPSKSVVPKDDFPNWSESKFLTAILLHEIGHVLGNPHIAGTIMDESIADRIHQGYWEPRIDSLLWNAPPEVKHEWSNKWFTSINGLVLLPYANETENRIEGILSTDQDEMTRAYEYLFGKKPHGFVKVSMSLISKDTTPLKLLLGYNDGTTIEFVTVGLEQEKKFPYYEAMVSQAFKRSGDTVWQDGQSYSWSEFSQAKTISITSKITLSNGKSGYGQYALNLDSPLIITILDDQGLAMPLFYGVYIHE